jgi:archaellum biogenesis ATPase FlaH
MERPDLDFLWAGMIPRPSIVVLEGAPKVGKSFLALQIAKAVSEGSEFGGRPCKQAKVLYLILEDEITWYDRMKNLIKHGYKFPPLLFIPHPFHPDKPFVQHIIAPETQRWLNGMLKETDPEMVVIDPIREIHTLDEQDSTQMKVVGDALMTIFHGRTILALHHTKKYETDPENPRPPNVILAGRGSSYLAGKASAVWLLWKAHEDATQGLFLGVPRFSKSWNHNLEQRDPGLWHWEMEKPQPIEQLPPDVFVCK